MNAKHLKPYTFFGLALATMLLVPQLGHADTNRNRTNPFINPVQNVQPISNVDLARANELSNLFRSASDKVLPSLVAIETRLDQASVPDQNRRNPFVTPRRSQPASGIGSGVIVGSSGVILTNNHVVMGGQGQVTVRLNDGREFAALEVLCDPVTDIAVVRIDAADELVACPMGDSEFAEIGDWVLALGQPFGLESTVTAGIISAKQRGIGMNERENFLQTDAAINPGNSGGPLVNLQGQVVGINTAISSRSGGNEGIGFAIPINLARWVGGQLMEHRTVKRSFIGVGIQKLDAALATKFGVPPRTGALVNFVQPDSPGFNSGLSAGDILVSFDQQNIHEPAQLQLAVERCEPGQKKLVNIIRNGKELQLSIYPSQLPGQEPVAAVANAGKRQTRRPNSKLGMQVANLEPELAARIGIPETDGVLITAIANGSPAQQAGLQPGFVIIEVDRQPVDDLNEFSEAIGQANFDDGILMLVKAGQGSRFIVMKSDG